MDVFCIVKTPYAVQQKTEAALPRFHFLCRSVCHMIGVCRQTVVCEHRRVFHDFLITVFFHFLLSVTKKLLSDCKPESSFCQFLDYSAA